jgi:sialate O-acetylesterase
MIVAVALAIPCHAEPRLPTLFSNHMVLQRDREIHVWGNADPNEKIDVFLAGHSVTVRADTSGRWSVHFPPMTAGGPFTLVVQGKKKIVFKDVLVGEVWLASGQSNMAFELSRATGSEVEVPNADYPQIRLFTVPKKVALSPQPDTPPAAWQTCTPDNAKQFSAVAYFFARDLYKSLGVPVGIIESVWPGTTIEEWIAPNEMGHDPELKPILDEWARTSEANKKFAQEPLPFELEFDDFELLPATGNDSTNLADFNDGTSRTAMGGSFSYGWEDAPDSTFELVSPGRGGNGFAARISGILDEVQDSTLRASYKLDRASVDLTKFSGVRFWVRGNGSFRFRSQQPTITDYDDYSTQVLRATPDWQTVTILFRDLRQEGWGVVKPFTQDALSGFSIEDLTTLGYAPMPVSALYQGMIAPLLPYSFRGVIWYQGESNALRAHQYRKLLPALMANWRTGSKNTSMDFLVVQLPNHGATPPEPGDSAWAELREAQLLAVTETSHAGMAVTIDVGDPNDVHPHHKLEVGHRLALWALGTTYQQPIVYSGPLFESMHVEGSKVRIHFSHTGTGLAVRGGGPLEGFAVSGKDRRFHWANAQIDGDTVLVSSSDVPDPIAVRYAWADSPVCNFFNKDGLPASPFRTDDWPGITASQLN